MIKVAWTVPHDPRWIGGLNYFVNLGSALLALPERRIEPVVMGNTVGLPEPLNSLNSLSYPRRYSLAWLLFRLERKFCTGGGALARILKKHGIALFFSNDLPLGRLSPVPSLCWIPDFQHKHLSHMFSREEIANRDATFASIAQNSQAVLLSSADAEKDFHHFFPQAAGKTHVLRFVANPPAGSEDIAPILACYEIEEPYFHIPNQLWRHKNHGVVLEALRILRTSGSCPLVISTGQTDDYRHPGYFAEFREQVAAAGLAERFRFLGLIDFAHAGALMRGAVAMINPSRFEGWSTTVEESKSLGKRLLLSDIPVHREQAPERGIFFGLDDAEGLAALMRRVLKEYSPAEEEEARKKTAAALPERVLDFARAYEDIVFKIVGDA